MPIDRGIIDQQLQALGDGSQWWSHRELRDLPKVLDADEQILVVARGKVGRIRFVRRSWLIVLTDRRLLCMRSYRGTSWQQLELKADQIARVALRIGLFRGRVIIAANGHTYRLLVPRPDAYRLNSALVNFGIPARDPITGFAPTRMAKRVMDHVLALPAAALEPDEKPRALPAAPKPVVPDPRVEELENEVGQLREQIEFLEDLLNQRSLAKRLDA